MGKDKLEQIVNEKLGSYESQIDADALWSSIQSVGGATTVSSKTAVGSAALLKWLGFAVVLIGAVSIGYWYGSAQSSDSVEEAVSETTIENIALVQQDGNPELEEQDVNPVSEEVVMDAKAIVVETETKVSDIENLQTRNRNQNTKQSQSPIQLSNAQEAQSIEATDLASTAVENFGRKSSNVPPVSKAESKAVVDESNESSSVVAITNQISPSESSSGAVASTSFTEVSRALMNDDMLVNEIDQIDYIASLERDIKLPKKVVCPTFGGSSNRGYFMPELQVIPFYANPIYSTTSEEGDEWVARKKATESYLEAFQVNLIGRYQFNSGFYLQGGVGYGQIDEKFMLFSEDIQVTDDEVPVIIILRPNGVSDTIRGNQQIETITTLQAETFNYHRMFELPFAIGYEYGWGTNLGLYIDMGGSVNLTTFRKGFMVIDDVDYVSFDDETRPIYKASTGFKVQGSVGLRYYMSNGLHFSAGPDIRYHTGNWIRDEHPFQQRYFDAGIRLAMGVRF